MTTSDTTKSELELKMSGFSLITAEILYRMPDHKNLLQSFLWQEYDIHPRFPKLHEFLDFWSQNLDGPLHRVRVAHQGLIEPTEFRYYDGQLCLN